MRAALVEKRLFLLIGPFYRLDWPYADLMKAKRRFRARNLPVRSSTAADSTVGRFLESCLDSPLGPDLLNWPPDVFGMMSALLQKTGAYIRVTSAWPPKGPNGGNQKLEQWLESIQRIGVEWWKAASFNRKPPAEVRQWWDAVIAQSTTPLTLIAETEVTVFWDAVLQLVAVADESCRWIGTLGGSPYAKNETDPDLVVQAKELLRISTKGGRASACRRLLPMCGSVLPKMHTPENGITLRSISHYLAFVRAADICPKYYYAFPVGPDTSTEEMPGNADCINVLLVPWPPRVNPTDFGVAPNRAQKVDGKFGFFSYISPSGGNIAAKLQNLINVGQDSVGRIHGVILPEMAVREGQEKKLFKILTEAEPNAFLIAGSGKKGTGRKRGSNNAVYLRNFGGNASTDVCQPKHHRWRLDERQIEMYGLGGRFDPARHWWEDISVKSRELAFIGFNDNITISVLICEDLARQDPVSDAMRSVGPNLVVALLMDGPQLESRWPAHYATVLADDPGSSVLTVTSLGMTLLSRPANKPVSRVVALWKDHIRGFRQIELPEGSDAVVLSLTPHKQVEWAADGRTDRAEATYLLLNGVHPISLSRGVLKAPKSQLGKSTR